MVTADAVLIVLLHVHGLMVGWFLHWFAVRWKGANVSLPWERPRKSIQSTLDALFALKAWHLNNRNDDEKEDINTRFRRTMDTEHNLRQAAHVLFEKPTKLN